MPGYGQEYGGSRKTGAQAGRRPSPAEAAFTLSGVERPHNDMAETAVLGAMMISPEAAATAFGMLGMDGAFSLPANQMVFDAMKDVAGGASEAAIDPIVLSERLAKDGRLDAVGGLDALFALMEAVPTAANIEHYCGIVRQNAMLRKVMEVCGDAILKCSEGAEDASELLGSVEQRIFEVSSMGETKGFVLAKDVLPKVVRMYDDMLHHRQEAVGLRTGFDFDRYIGGLKPGELFILAARPSIGKTALALNIVENIAMREGVHVPVGVFSLEMPAEQLVARLMNSMAKVSFHDYWNGTVTNIQQRDLERAGMILKESGLAIDDTGGINILELRAKARRMKRQFGTALFVVDYLQLVQCRTKSSDNRENEIARISASLKAMAKELSVPVVALAQLNRQAENGGRPQLSNLRESGAIEQDADVVAILHRDREAQMKAGGTDAGLDAEVIIAKNRNGGTGTSNLLFFPAYTRFENKAPVDDKDYEAMNGGAL